MDVIHYLTTTLTNVFGKVLPWIGMGAFLYLISIKLPFQLLMKVQKENKKPETGPPEKQVEIVADVSKPQEKIRIEGPRPAERKVPPKQKPKKAHLTLAEEVFDLEAGQILSTSELKKRYHDLLRKHHPDKVDALGNDFKKLAEKKTKEINQAYQKLKSKAS